VAEPTGKARDSSLGIVKAPEIGLLTRAAAPRDQCRRVPAPRSQPRQPAPFRRRQGRRQRVRETLDPLGGAFDALRARALRRLDAIGGGKPRFLQASISCSERADAAAAFGQFVGDHDRGHHGEPRIADLAECLA